jgi:hypothetical protein
MAVECQARHLDVLGGVEPEHMGLALNMLETPGHQDSSEDTYRTLTAADSDREGRDPFDLLDEIGQPLALDVIPASPERPLLANRREACREGPSDPELSRQVRGITSGARITRGRELRPSSASPAKSLARF